MTEDLPYQWFAKVWKLMNANKLNVSDSIIQEIFEAKGKERDIGQA